MGNMLGRTYKTIFTARWYCCPDTASTTPPPDAASSAFVPASAAPGAGRSDCECRGT